MQHDDLISFPFDIKFFFAIFRLFLSLFLFTLFDILLKILIS